MEGLINDLIFGELGIVPGSFRLISFFANIAKILNRDGEMAVHMKSIPTLRSQVESRCIAMFEDNFLRRVFHGSILEGRFYVEMWKRGLSPIPHKYEERRELFAAGGDSECSG